LVLNPDFRVDGWSRSELVAETVLSEAEKHNLLEGSHEILRGRATVAAE
jgi:hypothetical protein